MAELTPKKSYMGRPIHCVRPSRGATKADLKEDHIKRMQIRRAKQAARTPTHRLKRDQPNYSNNCLSKYRKSIWPKDKVAKPGRMG